MMLSERLSSSAQGSDSVVVSALSTPDVVSEMEVSEMQSQYGQLISVYARILSEYEKASKAAANTRTKSLFPSKHTWNPVGRTLTSSEREMLNGPSQHVNVYKKLSVRDKDTNRLIEYSSTDVELIPHNIPKQSSSFVTINAADERSKPLFGVVVKLFSHSFAQNTFYWAVIQQFAEPVFDSELKMWHVCVDVDHTYTSSLIMLPNLSYPLVVAVDDNEIWFLNS